MKSTGKIKWYSKSKKFGFISSEEDETENIFFRVENLKKSLDLLDKEESKITPENGDVVEFDKYIYNDQKRAKNIVIKQRSSISFVCPSCKEVIVPKIIMNQNHKRKEKKIGVELEEDVPVKKVCPNCYYLIEEFKTTYDNLNKYNKYAGVILILLITYIFHRILN